MNQKIVTCFLVIVDDEINQNPEHNEYIKWWVEGQCLQNKNILLGQWSLLNHYLWSCNFANLKPWGKIWQSKINNMLKAMFGHFLVKLRVEHFVYKMIHAVSFKCHIKWCISQYIPPLVSVRIQFCPPCTCKSCISYHSDPGSVQHDMALTSTPHALHSLSQTGQIQQYLLSPGQIQRQKQTKFQDKYVLWTSVLHTQKGKFSLQLFIEFIVWVFKCWHSSTYWL